MPIDKLRFLSLLVIGASTMAFLSGDFGSKFFLIQLLTVVPIWFDIDIQKIRGFQIWKYYAYFTFALFFASYYFNLFSMRTSIFLLVLFCLVYEFYGEKRVNAPMRLIGLLSFLIVIYQARVESGIQLFYGVVIYLSCVVLCLMGFYTGPFHHFKITSLVKRKVLAVGGHLVAIFVIGFCAFWLMPRLPDQSLAVMPSLNGDRVSGFSDRVTLTDIGSLKLSRKHVLDLKTLSDRLHSRYLKGRVLDHYEDGVWMTTTYSITYPDSLGDNRFVLPHRRLSQTEYHYLLDLEALHGNTIFFFDNLIEINGNLNPLKVVGNNDHISVLRGYPLSMSYQVVATDEPVSYHRHQRMDIYLQIPSEQTYFSDIASDIMAGSGNSTDQKVDWLLRYFRSRFSYTLEIHNQRVKDPLADFLDKKRGHCELFASSMVLLLRAQDIPARLVTGFLVPEIHPSGQFYYITESDAHAWVEYYDDGSWKTVDPTPPGNYVSPGFAESQIAYLRRFWRNMVITFDYESQIAAFKAVRSGLYSLFLYGKRHPEIYLLPLIALLIPFYILKFRPILANKDVQMVRCFLKIEKNLKIAHGPRRYNETFMDYLIRLDMESGLRKELLGFLKNYRIHRFGRDQHRKNIDQTRLLKRGRFLIHRLKSTEGGQ